MFADMEVVDFVVVDMWAGMDSVLDMQFVVVHKSAFALLVVHLGRNVCSTGLQYPWVAELERNMPSLLGREVGIVA